MTLVRGLGRFLYDFVVGDDGRVALAVAASLVLTWLLLATGVPALVAVIVGAVGVAGTFTAVLLLGDRRPPPPPPVDR